MCMMFGCNPLLFRSSDLVIFEHKALRYWVACGRNSAYSYSRIWNFAGVFSQDLKMCMMFRCNSQIHCCHFLPV